MPMFAKLCAGAVLLMMVVATPGIAAPLCVSVQGLGDSCIYVDPHDCQQRAQQLGGSCAANPLELTTNGNGTFCTIDTSLLPQCIYSDRQTCSAAAERVSGACIVAHPQALDAFKTTRPY